MRVHPGSRRRGGFTLAEAAITIALVALTLTTLLQILEGSKFTAAHTRAQKIARDLALQTLGEIESGLWWDDIGTLRNGDYAEEGYGAYQWELAVGDETFSDLEQEDYERPFDSWAYREEQRLENEEDSDQEDEEGEPTEPFEKVRIRVYYPRYRNFPSDLTLERWIPWEQVYGSQEEEEEDGPQETDGGPPPGPDGQEGSGG